MKLNLDVYNKIFESLFDVEEIQLNNEFNSDTVSDWDSLAHMELVSQIEDAFDIMLETDDIIQFKGYEHGKKILEKYGIII